MQTNDQLIRVAHSPDADDAFMFWALARGRLATPGLRFAFNTADTQALNDFAGAASGSPPDICAVSIHQYAYIHDRYVLLPHGGSVGVGYGPVVVTRADCRSLPGTEQMADRCAWLSGRRIGVPGLRTTAYLVLRLLVPQFDAIVVPISPFARILDAVQSGEVDAAVLIHEGRLLYPQFGFTEVLELGAAWKTRTGLPLPLGGNVIRRALGMPLIRRVSEELRRSIEWALEHRDEVIDDLLASEQRAGVPRDRQLFDRYLAMYANGDTLDYGADGRRAIATLFQMAHSAGLLPRAVEPEFAP